jgi:hypothetical protein
MSSMAKSLFNIGKFPLCVPGAAQHGAQRNGALPNRDRRKRRVCNDPGAAVHRCALHRVRETFANVLKFYAGSKAKLAPSRTM